MRNISLLNKGMNMSSNQDYVETMILELSECLRELVDLQPHQYDDRWETAMQNAYELLKKLNA